MVTPTKIKIMKTIQFATSAGPDVQAWMTDSHVPRILNVFGLASNLINERGEIMSLVSQEIGNGPFNLVISPQDYAAIFDQIDSQSSISIRYPELKIGRVAIDVQQAILWNAKPDWASLATNMQMIVSNLLFRMDRLVTQAHPDSLFSLLSRPDTLQGSQLINFVNCQENTTLKTPQSFFVTTSWMNSLFEAVHSVDLEACALAAQRLAGLGLGLTPAGDDFLIGAMYAAWMIHSQEKAELITSTIASTAIPRTNSLSAAWIRSAACGLVNEPWLDFLEGWKLLGQPTIESSLRKLLSIGHTSGEDALAGFIGCITYRKTRPDLKTTAELQNEYEISGRTFAVPLWD